MPLNHYAINQILGAKKMVAGRRVRFGRLAQAGIVADMLRNRPRPRAKVAFDLDADRIVFKAFVDVANGASAENILLNDALEKKFHTRARELGFHASDADLNRRLINIRKNPSRYKTHGLVIPDGTKARPRPSIVPRYAHVIEFALSKLRYRYGATIDDVLIDPDLKREYEEMVASVAPDLGSLEIRLAALYIRKTRYISKSHEALVESLNVSEIQGAFENLGPLSNLKSDSAPSGEGLIEILEKDRLLYVSRNEDLPTAIEQLASPSTLKFLANDFWHPKLDNLFLRTFHGAKYLKIPVSQWQLRIIQMERPVFNYPVAAA